jgi:hypothetical protein
VILSKGEYLDSMLRKSVTSSMASSIGYQNSILEIEFRSGEIWQYLDVPESVYLAMLISKSIGKFFQDHIKNKFPERRIK